MTALKAPLLISNPWHRDMWICLMSPDYTPMTQEDFDALLKANLLLGKSPTHPAHGHEC